MIEYKYTKLKNNTWRVTDSFGRSAEGITKEHAFNMYMLRYNSKPQNDTSMFVHKYLSNV